MPKVKALGVIWLAESDEFSFSSNINKNQNWTKRAVLSAYARLFDPIGLISPITISAKILSRAPVSRSDAMTESSLIQLLGIRKVREL